MSQREIFLGDTTSDPATNRQFHDLVDLVAHVADCYPSKVVGFPEDLKEILTRNHVILAPELREKIVGSLGLLRRKNVIDSASLLTTIFPVLVSTPSKSLRSLLFSKIISDLRASNSKTTNHKLNRTIQSVLYDLVTSDRSNPKAIWAIKLTRELWKRQVWTDSRPVEVMKEACLAENEKVVIGGIRFFLGGDKEREDLEDEESEDELDLSKIRHQMGINKKSKKKAKSYEQALSKIKKQERKKKKPHPLNFSALHLLHDPQSFADELFQKHLRNTKSKLTLESKILILQLVTRLVGLHKLIIESLYSWFTDRLAPKQQSVTSFLASLAQATHDLVPPDFIEPLVKKIANEFVNEAAAAEVAAAGLNAIREICVRQPLAIDETLLQDLVQYRKSKDKGVMMAAKGLLSLYRNVGAELLQKKDRGKDATIGLKSGNMQQKKYGEVQIGEIEGLELLEKWKEEERKRKRAEYGLPEEVEDDEKLEDSDGWEIASVNSTDSGGWINVSSESEDEGPPTKKRKSSVLSGGPRPDLEGEDKTETRNNKDFSKLATTTILTPADLQKLQELRMENQIGKAFHGNRMDRKRQEAIERHVDDALTAEQIEAPGRLRKLTKEEKLSLAKKGKPDREEHKSTQAIRKAKKEAAGKSTSNKEKQKRKNMLMTMGKAKLKQKRSLVATQKVLRGHVTRAKKGGRRGNF